MVKSYIITSAQYNAPIHKPFLKSLDSWCQSNNGELVVLPMAGRTIKDDTLADELTDLTSIVKSTNLNKNIVVSDFAIKPQQIDPVTGLGRFPQSNESTIFASPKQRLKVIPNSNNSLPKMLVSTGAVTKPYYNNNRIGTIATKDHVYGAVIVEVVDGNSYHIRPVRATSRGDFVDLGTRFSATKDPSKSNLEALVLGDIHVGDTSEEARQANYEQISTLNPKRIVLHDFFNGHSVNHHTWNELVTRAKYSASNKTSLEQELAESAEELSRIVELANGAEIVLVACNHHDFLTKYLQTGQFIKEPENARIAAQLFPSVVDGEDPVKKGIEMFYKIPSNVKFLTRHDDYKVGGWQLGAHGDKGGNGTRGTINSREAAYGRSISGHTHTPEILRDTYIVGTSTNLNLDYTSGPSSWMNTNAMLYDTGKVQLVNTIDGKWKP